MELGTVIGSSGYSYSVEWDEDNGTIYCKAWGYGSKYVGKASSPREAMQKAEAWAVQN